MYKHKFVCIGYHLKGHHKKHLWEQNICASHAKTKIKQSFIRWHINKQVFFCNKEDGIGLNNLPPHFNMQLHMHANEPPRIPCTLSKALRKSGHNFQKKITHKSIKLAFFDMKFHFFVRFINFIANFISYISKCFCVPS